jgi:predicted Rossmann-fold nucleotide-binding protein
VSSRRAADAAVIGVMGKSDTQDAELLALAFDLGRAIAEAGHIVLTGGHWSGVDESVKHHALLGAASVAQRGHIARILGIAPQTLSESLGHPSAGIEMTREADRPLRGFCLHTGLRSEQRNLITGGAPDVIVALFGEGGTAQEVSVALDSGRPVVFLRSYEALRMRLTRPPVAPLLAGNAGDAVTTALDAWRQSGQQTQRARWTDEFPQLAGPYDEALARLRSGAG